MKELFDNVSADACFLRGEYDKAFEMYFRGATVWHDSRAAFDVAFMYYFGLHVPKNDFMARDFYFAASAMDGGAALFNLALMDIRGQGAAADLDLAVRRMKQAAVNGCVDAQLYLGTAYTVGCVFDPLNIECLSLIPFYRVKPGSERRLLFGQGNDEAMEQHRFSVIEADELAAMEMFTLAAEQEECTYIDDQIGHARTMVGRALVEGFGAEYDPAKGYRMLEQAALENRSREAAAILAAEGEKARAYGIAPQTLKYLSEMVQAPTEDGQSDGR